MDGCLSALMPAGPLHAVADRLAGDGCKMLSQVSVMVCYAPWNPTLYSASHLVVLRRSAEEECSRGCEKG